MPANREHPKSIHCAFNKSSIVRVIKTTIYKNQTKYTFNVECNEHKKYKFQMSTNIFFSVKPRKIDINVDKSIHPKNLRSIFSHPTLTFNQCHLLLLNSIKFDKIKNNLIGKKHTP